MPRAWYPGRHWQGEDLGPFPSTCQGDVVGNVWDLGVGQQQVDLAVLPK